MLNSEEEVTKEAEVLDLSGVSLMERMLYVMNEIRIEKNGKNTFSNYDYFKPEEIKKKVNHLFFKYKIFPHFTTYIKGYETQTVETMSDSVSTKTQIEYREIAKLSLTDILNPNDALIYEMPLREIEIKGANKMQNVGGVRTYAKRYLYYDVLEISEHDHMEDPANIPEITLLKTRIAELIKSISSKDKTLRSNIGNILLGKYGSHEYKNMKPDDEDKARAIIEDLEALLAGDISKGAAA
jgi:hypothetical protein